MHILKKPEFKKLFMSEQVLAREVIQRAPAGWNRDIDELNNPLSPQVGYSRSPTDDRGRGTPYLSMCPPEIMEYEAEKRIFRRERRSAVRKRRIERQSFDPNLEKHPKSEELPEVDQDARWPVGEVIDELEGPLEFDEWRVIIKFATYELEESDPLPQDVGGVELEIGDYPKKEALEKMRELMNQVESVEDAAELYRNYDASGKHRIVTSHWMVPGDFSEVYSSSKTHLESLRKLPRAKERLERVKEEVEKLEEREVLELADER